MTESLTMDPGDMFPGQAEFTEMMIEVIRSYTKWLWGGPMDNRIVWMMICTGHSGWQFVRAAAPCWKGELVVPFGKFALVIGWNAPVPAEALTE